MSNSQGSAEPTVDEEAIIPLADARAHWSLFLPALLVALLYGVSYLLLFVAGKGDGDLARLVLVVFAVAPPLLLVGAFLRYYSTGLAVTASHVLVARGWPWRTGEEVALTEVSEVSTSAGWMQRRFGAGQVRLVLRGGRSMTVSDLRDPEAIAAAINGRLPRK